MVTWQIIQRVRQAQNIGVPELSRMTKISAQQLYKIEQGHSDLRLSTLAVIAKALGCRTEDLLPSQEEQKNTRLAQSLRTQDNG